MLHYRKKKKTWQRDSKRWKLACFLCAASTATLSLLSSAQWACCDEPPLMIINEIRVHYDESMLIIIQPLFFFCSAHNDQSRLKRISLWNSCGLQSSCFQGQSCSRGARPSIWKTYAPGYLLMQRQTASLPVLCDVISSFSLSGVSLLFIFVKARPLNHY